MRLVLNFLRHIYQSALQKNWKEWRVIFLCLLLSTTFWLINEFDKTYDTVLNVPIEIKYNHDDFVSLHPLPNQLGVRVSGTGWDVLKEIWIGNAKLEYTIHHPPSAKQLKQDLLVQKARKELKNINVLGVNTDTVKINFNKIAQKHIRLYINPANLDVAKGYEVKGEPEVEPMSILLTGAESIIKQISPTMPLVIEGNNLNKDIIATIKPNIVGFPYSQALFPTPDKVDIKIKIRAEIEEHLRIPIVTINDDGSLLLKKKSAYVSFLVSKDLKYKVQADVFEVQADLSNINWEDTTVNLNLSKIPDWVSDAKLEDKKVKIKPRK